MQRNFWISKMQILLWITYIFCQMQEMNLEYRRVNLGNFFRKGCLKFETLHRRSFLWSESRQVGALLFSTRVYIFPRYCSSWLSNGNGHIRLTFTLKFSTLTIVPEVCGGDTSYDISLHPHPQNIYTPSAVPSKAFSLCSVTAEFLCSRRLRLNPIVSFYR